MCVIFNEILEDGFCDRKIVKTITTILQRCSKIFEKIIVFPLSYNV